MGISVIKDKLIKTRMFLQEQFGKIIGKNKIDQEVLSELEAILIQADLGIDVANSIIKRLEKTVNGGKEEIYIAAKNIFMDIFSKGSIKNDLYRNPIGPTVILMLGVNGTGKTTTIAKLAYKLKYLGNEVLLAACDTFRAAAIEQLGFWAEKIGLDMIKHDYKADPSAVAYDALKAAINRKADYLILDTAGRFHTKTDLMDELKKIDRTLSKNYNGAPHERILIIDANTGQNALTQAKQFNEAVNLTGLIVTKLDGTAKGGIIVNIQKQLNLPVKFIGLGQELTDLEQFDPIAYVDAII